MRKKILLTILTITFGILLVLLVIFLNSKEEPDDTFVSEPIVEYCSNVYILSNSDNFVRYIQFGETYSVYGNLDDEHKDFTGFADILITDNILLSVESYKTECFSGTLLAYTDQMIEIEGQGWLNFSPEFQVFRTYNDELEVISLDDFVLGATYLQYYTDDYGVCGLIQDQRTETDDIRVVIKNDDTSDIFYKEIYLYSKGYWSVNGEELPPAKTFDVANYMRQSASSHIEIISDSPIAITDENGKKKSEYYQGSLTIINEDPLLAPTGNDISLVIVNTLPIETYVRYVLPSEMPKSFAYEAKKAQAVCARTYAYYQMKNGEYAKYGANLDDSTMYQVYNAKGTSDVTDKACAQTEGIVAACDSSLISCYYFSTSPGFTHGLEAWGAEPEPYLAFNNHTGEDYGDLALTANVSSALADSPKVYDNDSPFLRWKATLNFSSKAINAAADPEYGKLLSFEITNRTEAGYICGMEIRYVNGSRYIESELDVRRFFGNFLTKLTLSDGSSRSDFEILPCAFFVEENLRDSFDVKSLSGKKLTLIGGGFGHGIGMSQYGADGMAKSGKDYSDILNYYYKNIELVNVKELDAFK